MMQLNIFSIFGLTLALTACTDAGVIGEEVSSVGGMGGKSSTAAAGNPSVGGATAGGNNASSSAGAPIVGGAATGGATTGGATTGGAATGGATTGMGGNAGTAAAGGSNLPAPPIVSATAASCNIALAESPTVSTWTLPADLASPHPLWDTLVSVCGSGGWDLYQCAGNDTVHAVAATGQVRDGNPVLFHTITKGDVVCCAYQSYDPTTPVLGTPQTLPASCGPHRAAVEFLSACDTVPAGDISAQQIDIPSDLSGPNWGVKAIACTEGAWDLAVCAGKTATFTSFEIGPRSAERGMTKRWIVQTEGKVCCVYDSDGSTPGIYAHACGV